MKSIFEALSHTPTWVYILFVYLLWVGFKASKTRIISLKKLFIIPAIFTYMSINTLVTAFNIQIFEVSVWSSSILIGISIGWIDVYRKYTQIKVDKQKHLIEVPGTWVTLSLILIIFTSKYYFSYELAVDPTLSNQTWFEVSMLTVSGICTGLFIGRLLSYLYKYAKSNHTSLTKTE
jgi:hypothetical protein